MTCEILIFKNGEQAVAGTVTLSKGKISVKPTTAADTRMMQQVLKQPGFIDGQRTIDPKTDPVAWFKALPATYNGTYVRARIAKA